MIQRILIPVDFSETSAAAAEYGCALAARLSAEVTLLHIYSLGIVATPDTLYAPTPEEKRAVADAAQARLEAIGKRLGRDGLTIRCEIVEGTPADAIIGWAARRHPDLIVMGTHGRRGMSHFLLGSVAEQTVRGAACPVLTIGQKCAEVGHAVAP